MFKRGLPYDPNMDEVWWKKPSAFPLILMLTAFTIIVVGGTIRISDAGESCPDWPTCFGTWSFDVSVEEQTAYWEAYPEQEDSRGIDHRYTTFEIFTEWFHRLLVGIVAIPILLNFLYVKKHEETYGPGVKKAAFLAGILLIIQAFAGYITVLFDNIDWSVALHLSLACIWSAVLLYQYLQMRLKEGADWQVMQTSDEYIGRHKGRIDAMAIAVFVLLILGAWVASTAGGQYNQGCSVGFPDGWPKCQGEMLPSMDGPGVIVQMVHRIGAIVVGIILMMGISKMKEDSRENGESTSLSKFQEWVLGLWSLNVLVGGSYIVLADANDFPEWLSLVHLTLGVGAVMFALTASLFIRLKLAMNKE